MEKEGILSDKDLDMLQKRISEISVPPKFTKIPYKIGSGFSSLTADQLKCWTNIYSLLLLTTSNAGAILYWLQGF